MHSRSSTNRRSVYPHEDTVIDKPSTARGATWAATSNSEIQSDSTASVSFLSLSSLVTITEHVLTAAGHTGVRQDEERCYCIGGPVNTNMKETRGAIEMQWQQHTEVESTKVDLASPTAATTAAKTTYYNNGGSLSPRAASPMSIPIVRASQIPIPPLANKIYRRPSIDAGEVRLISAQRTPRLIAASLSSTDSLHKDEDPCDDDDDDDTGMELDMFYASDSMEAYLSPGGTVHWRALHHHNNNPSGGDAAAGTLPADHNITNSIPSPSNSLIDLASACEMGEMQIIMPKCEVRPFASNC